MKEGGRRAEGRGGASSGEEEGDREDERRKKSRKQIQGRYKGERNALKIRRRTKWTERKKNEEVNLSSHDL